MLQGFGAAARGQTKAHGIAAQGIDAHVRDEGERLEVALHRGVILEVVDSGHLDIEGRERAGYGIEARVGVGCAVHRFRRRPGELAAAVLKQIDPAHRAGIADCRTPDQRALAAGSMSEFGERRRRGCRHGSEIEVISRKVRGARPEHGDAALRRGRTELGFDRRGGVLRRDHRAPLPGLHGEPHERRGTLASPQGLIVLGEPAVERGTVEGHPELIVGCRTVLLHIAAGAGDERSQRGILVHPTAAGHLDQHGPERCLEGGFLPRLGALGQRGRRLVELDARKRRARIGKAERRGARAHTQPKPQSKPADEGISYHDVIA